MSDKPAEDQPVQGEVNKQAPDVPSIRSEKEPNGNGVRRPASEKANDREGQTREQGYDEA